MFHTIKSQDNFQNIYKTGKKIYGTYSLLFYKENQINHNQYGFVASKKIGNAVCRNRIKRLFREFIKQNEILLPKSTTFILVAKKNLVKKSKQSNTNKLKKIYIKYLK